MKRTRNAEHTTDKRVKHEPVEGFDDEISAEIQVKDEKIDVKDEKVDVKDEKIDVRPNFFPRVTAQDMKSAGPKAPKGWNDIYDAVADMRGKIMTPVDTMGCERIPTSIEYDVKERDPRSYRFQLLLALMLSSQTKDEVNFEAMRTLQAGLQSRGFATITIDGVMTLSPQELDGYIRKVGFHNRKTTFILKACQILKDKHDGDIPQTIEEIVALPGVGPKMGHLLLQRGWNIVTGIGVDVHIHRLAKMWGWVRNSEKPEVTRHDLEEWLPQSLWADINPLLVGFGQAVCTPQAKNCDICTLSRQGLCKGVDRKRMRTELTPERISKLQKGRADVSELVIEIET